MLGRRGICGISASRRWPPPAPGFAFSRGLPDAERVARRNAQLTSLRLSSSTDLPVNADFESGYARDPEGVAESVRLCVETGVAGLSIEDSTGDPSKPLYDIPMAVERMKAARAAIGDSGVLLIGRAECFLVGHAGATKRIHPTSAGLCGSGRGRVVRAGTFEQRADIQAIVSAVSPKPVNVLMSANTGLKVSGSGGDGRAANQRGEFVGACGVGRVHPRGKSHRGGRKLRWIRRLGSVCRTERISSGRI